MRFGAFKGKGFPIPYKWVNWKTITISAVGATSVVILWDILKKTRSQQSASTLLRHYIINHGMKLFGSYCYNQLEVETKMFMEVQRKTLQDYLRKNANTQYGIEHGFAQMTTVERFLQLHPITTYNHYRHYIDHIEYGDKNVMTVDPCLILGVTSGISGECKLVPTISRVSFTFFRGVAVLYHLMIMHFPEIMNLQKDFKIFFSPKKRSSPAGIPIGPNSSNPQNSKSVWCMYSTPPPAFGIMTEPEALYIHLLFALKDRNLGMIEANFVSLIYNAFHVLKIDWRQMVQDIETGIINRKLNISSDVRKKLQAFMVPDLKRSTELRQEFNKGFYRIAKRIWPKMYLILSVDTGSFDLYGKLLQNNELHGIPMYSPLYAASEGLMGINLNPESEKREYTLVPHAMFYEFLPVQFTDQEIDEETECFSCLANQVRVGDLYELVITNMSGLCRYRLGDIVRVTGFHNQAPKVEFMYRLGQLLNVRGEKLSERTFYAAIQALSERWKEEAGITVVDYCCAESVTVEYGMESSASAPQYIVFVELRQDQSVGEEELKQLDEYLQKESFVYQSFRKKGSIAECVVYLVETGTFQQLRKFILRSTDASSNQYKVPRVLKRKEAVNFMMAKRSQTRYY